MMRAVVVTLHSARIRPSNPPSRWFLRTSLNRHICGTHTAFLGAVVTISEPIWAEGIWS